MLYRYKICCCCTANAWITWALTSMVASSLWLSHPVDSPLANFVISSQSPIPFVCRASVTSRDILIRKLVDALSERMLLYVMYAYV